MACKLKSLQYRKTLSDIGRKLTDDDMRSIRFISKAVSGLTKRDLELEEPLEFFVKLEERGVLAYDDTDFLKELLSMVHRQDCLSLLDWYESGSPSADSVSSNCTEPVQATGYTSYCGGGRDSTDSMHPYSMVTQRTSNAPPMPVHNTGMIQQVTESSRGEDLSGIFDIVVEEIGRDWRQLARKLHLTETEIERITNDHMRNLREQSMQCLLLWKKKMRSQATKAALIEALKKCQMLYIADRLEGCQFR